MRTAANAMAFINDLIFLKVLFNGPKLAHRTMCPDYEAKARAKQM